jgi:hypothetical protein
MDTIIDVLSAYECCVEDDLNEPKSKSYNCIKQITGLDLSIIKTIMELLVEYHGNLL